MDTETINVELNGTEYEIAVSKITGAIDSIDQAFAAQAARRMKRGRYTRVMEVLCQCDMDHEPEEITEEMMECFVKEHFIEKEEATEQEGVEKMEYTSEEEFEEAHEHTCGYEGPWVSVSPEYGATRIQCPECGAVYEPEQEYFAPEANPIYNNEGRCIGSGEYVNVGFWGYIPR